MYPFSTEREARAFAKMVAEELLHLQQYPKSKHITFAEAMRELGIKNHALKRRIDKSRIPTYRHGRGKAFDRTYLPYLK